MFESSSEPRDQQLRPTKSKHRASYYHAMAVRIRQPISASSVMAQGIPDHQGCASPLHGPDAKSRRPLDERPLMRETSSLVVEWLWMEGHVKGKSFETDAAIDKTCGAPRREPVRTGPLALSAQR